MLEPAIVIAAISGRSVSPTARNPRGDREGERVVADRPAEVLAHLPHRATADLNRRRDVEGIRAHQDDVGRLDRHVGARADRDARRRPCASAGASLTPSPTIATRRPWAWSWATRSAFSPGSTSASTSSMPTSAATRSAVARLSPVSITGSTPRPRSAAIASPAVVAGRRRRSPAGRRPGRRSRPWTTVRPSPARRAAAPSEPPETDALALHEAGVADGEAVALDGGERAVPGELSKAVGPRQRDAALPGLAHDGLGERMLALALDGRRQPQQLVLVDPVSRDDLDDRRLAARQGAGLVEDDRVEARRLLERDGVLDEDAALRARGRCPP